MALKTSRNGRLLKLRDLRWLWISQAISQIGEGLNKVPLLYLVYNLTDSPVIITTVIAVLKTLPPLILGTVVGFYIDHFRKKWIWCRWLACRIGVGRYDRHGGLWIDDRPPGPIGVSLFGMAAISWLTTAAPLLLWKFCDLSHVKSGSDHDAGVSMLTSSRGVLAVFGATGPRHPILVCDDQARLTSLQRNASLVLCEPRVEIL